MVIIGNDVVSLFPNLDVNRVAQNMKEAVLSSPVRWAEIDYLEATRYIALNWTDEQCQKSNLRRVLPRRRGKTGTRPGMRGEGPRGLERGDQEQWVFRNIKLEEHEKLELIATVIEASWG